MALWPRWTANAYLADLRAGLDRVGVSSAWAGRSNIAGRAGCDVVHVQWPDAVWSGSARGRLWRLATMLWMLPLSRLRRIPLAVTVHNLGTHDEPSGFGDRVARAIMRRADRLIVLSPSGVERTLSFAPGVDLDRVRVIPHMDWCDRYRHRSADEVQAFRELHRLPAGRLVVWFGRVLPYKGIEGLAARVDGGGLGNLHLLVMGEGAASSLGSDDVTHVDRRVTDGEIELALSAADAAVFPFEAIENSGSVLAALAVGTPVVAPRLGALTDLEDEYGTELVRLYDPSLGDDELRELLAADAPKTAPPRSPARRSDAVAAAHRALYAELMEAR